MAAITGTVIDQRWRRRRGKVLVLGMKIYHPSYLLFLNFCLVFDQIELSVSKGVLLVVAVKDIPD